MSSVSPPGKSLATLLQPITVEAPQRGQWPTTVQVTGLATDSRQVSSGDLFIGLPGTQVDGGVFWSEAAIRGAVAAVISAEALAIATEPATIPIWAWPAAELPRICGQLAAAFYDYPGQQLGLVGVTGTNGKTTTTHLIEHLLLAAGEPTALIGTLYNRWPGYSRPASHTTPFAPDLQRLLAIAQQAGSRWGVLEVSSHSLSQQRVWGCEFAAAVWTNLTQDHLDFHQDMAAYWQAKATLFEAPYLTGRAIINGDDAGGQQLWHHLRTQGSQLSPWLFTLATPAAIPIPVPADQWLWASEVQLGATETQAVLHTPAGDCPVIFPLVGQFNLANLLGAVGAALHLGVTLDTIRDALPSFAGVPGRVNRVQVPMPENQASAGEDLVNQDIAVIVDYAHTPDGLRNLLSALRPSVQNQLICVFGCGGDRDRQKRPQMGEIAVALADQVIITSDNPRTEDPQQILADVAAGTEGHVTPVRIEGDRRLAIFQAINQAQAGDMVVIAGKGHEDYQILGKVKVPFDDREVAIAALQQRLGLTN